MKLNEYNYNSNDFINSYDNRNIQYDFLSNYMNANMPSAMNFTPNMSDIGSVMTNQNILDPYKGFIRGNMFENLYDGYKNYKIAEINPKTEKEALLNQWQQYNFALEDLNLYLDIYPNDRNALELYKKYLTISKDIKNKYESMYGPLYVSSDYVTNGNWKWIGSPWPWEGVI